MLTNLIGGLSVEALPGTQLLHELTAQLDVAVVSVALLVELAQPLASAASTSSPRRTRSPGLRSASRASCTGGVPVIEWRGKRVGTWPVQHAVQHLSTETQTTEGRPERAGRKRRCSNPMVTGSSIEQMAEGEAEGEGFEPSSEVFKTPETV